MHQPPASYIHSLYEGVNRTELYQICRSLNKAVHPSWSKRELILALLDDPEDPDVVNPFDELRWALIGFISKYWRTLQPQLKCPAMYLKHPDPTRANPRPCFGCSDMQAVACVHKQAPDVRRQIMQERNKR